MAKLEYEHLEACVRPIGWSISLCCCLILSLGLTLRAQDVPRYKVDPFWPKELPNNWILGRVPGVAVDKDDHIWILHSPGSVRRDEAGLVQTPPLSECCRPAPAVIEFDANGNVLRAWGGPGYVADWPIAEHGFTVDREGNVWIGGSYTGEFSENTHRSERGAVWHRQVMKLST
jgi:hypothetical protein